MNSRKYLPEEGLRQTLPLNFSQYQTMYEQSIEDPDTFWAEQAKAYLTWYKPWTYVHESDFTKAEIKWFQGGKLNACYNCVDRHLPLHAKESAIIWQSDDLSQHLTWTYERLHEEVCRLANVLKNEGIKKGDRVCIYLPMIPESVAAMLACARIGAIHSVIFAGFSAHALHSRIQDAKARIVITADEGLRGGKKIPLKAMVDEALTQETSVQRVLVVKHTGTPISFQSERDIWYHKAVKQASVDCPCEVMEAESPLFILYTSGSTGQPKGVLHTTAGYLLYSALTFQTVFDYRPHEVHWCTADIGWITGHSYVVYGPLANRATVFIDEGVPLYPDAGRFWQTVEKHGINILYTAPTALRALMREGDEWIKKHNRSSLRVLGSVGEPINPEVWEWYYHVIGEARCPVIDTWWQTETGGFLITPFANVTPLKPGSATLPFFGVKPALLNSKGEFIEGEGEGSLVIASSWPGQMRTVYGDQQRFFETYFSSFPGYYLTGDAARRDQDGYYWILGRTDDVINVSGHRLGTAEIESALVMHSSVAESAVVGYPHDIKGQGIFAFVILKHGMTPSDELKKALAQCVTKEISPIARPDKIVFVDALPKTRSGKIMRRIMRKIAEGETEQLGDLSTLADPACVAQLIEVVKHA